MSYNFVISKVVLIDKSSIDKINGFVIALADAKIKEWHYAIDGNKLVKRLTTGLIGERALEIMLGTPIINWTIGNSRSYNTPDIPHLGIGVKTVEKGLYPLVSVKPKTAQIICIKDGPDRVIVCGLASIAILKKYSNLDLVVDYRARMRGTKAGFYGLDKLEKFSNLDELEILCGVQHVG
jgi:hypothetical protein